eukprot:767090-Hanusia_phi.AAC.2
MHRGYKELHYLQQNLLLLHQRLLFHKLCERALTEDSRLDEQAGGRESTSTRASSSRKSSSYSTICAGVTGAGGGGEQGRRGGEERIGARHRGEGLESRLSSPWDAAAPARP